MVVGGHVAAGSVPWEPPVPGREGCWSPRSGWSQAGRHMAGRQETETWIDTTCRNEVKYLFRELWRGRQKGRREMRGERERERGRER